MRGGLRRGQPGGEGPQEAVSTERQAEWALTSAAQASLGFLSGIAEYFCVLRTPPPEGVRGSTACLMLVTRHWSDSASCVPAYPSGSFRAPLLLL